MRSCLRTRSALRLFTVAISSLADPELRSGHYMYVSSLLLTTCARGASRLAGLAEFAAHALALVTDALALVRLGRPYGADLRGELADLLLVRAADDDLVRALDLDVDAGRRLHHHRVREPDGDVQLAALRLRAVADAYDVERLRKTARHAAHHVGDQRAREAVQLLAALVVVGAQHVDRAVLDLDVDRLGAGQLQLAFRTLDGHDALGHPDVHAG